MRQCVFLFVALLLFSCTPKFDLGDAVFEPQIVVEGWIESGGVANVCLSQSMTLVDGIRYCDTSSLGMCSASASSMR